MKNKKTLLMILDGWGIGDGTASDVISTAPTPNLDFLKKNYPNSRLFASGEDVGLTRRSDGKFGSGTSEHRSRQDNLPGSGENKYGMQDRRDKEKQSSDRCILICTR